jgi:hypothetical protein
VLGILVKTKGALAESHLTLAKTLLFRKVRHRVEVLGIRMEAKVPLVKSHLTHVKDRAVLGTQIKVPLKEFWWNHTSFGPRSFSLGK